MSGLPDVSGSSLVIWGTIAFVLLIGAGTATDKGLGPISRAYFAFAKNRRTAAAERRGSDYLDLKQQLDRLVEVVEQLRQDQTARDDLAVAHTEWDRNARMRLADAGIQLPPPPPLIPPQPH